MARRSPIDGHVFRLGDRVVLDTNVLILVYGDTEVQSADDLRTKPYASALLKIESAGAEGVVLDTVLSEFINAMERREAEDWADSLPRRKRTAVSLRKRFRRDRAAYGRAMSKLGTTIDELTQRFKFATASQLDPRASIDTIAKMARHGTDFNDIRIAGYCRQNRTNLLTDDEDMARIKGDFTVLTSRRR